MSMIQNIPHRKAFLKDGAHVGAFLMVEQVGSSPCVLTYWPALDGREGQSLALTHEQARWLVSALTELLEEPWV